MKLVFEATSPCATCSFVPKTHPIGFGMKRTVDSDSQKKKKKREFEKLLSFLPRARERERKIESGFRVCFGERREREKSSAYLPFRALW